MYSSLSTPFLLISIAIAPLVIWIYNCKSYTPLIHTHTHKRIIPPTTLLPFALPLSPLVMPRVDCRFTTGNCWLRAINYSTHFGAARFYCCPPANVTRNRVACNLSCALNWFIYLLYTHYTASFHFFMLSQFICTWPINYDN